MHDIYREFKPGEVAKLFGVTPATIRNWKRRDLFRPSDRDGHPRYSLPDLACFDLLQRLSELGVNLEIAARVASARAVKVANIMVAQEKQLVPNEIDGRFIVLSVLPDGQMNETGGLDLSATWHRLESGEDDISVAAIVDMYGFARNLRQRIDGPIILNRTEA